jgi:5-deoxy-glucuronate isomerase
MGYHFGPPEAGYGLRSILAPPQGDLRYLSVWRLFLQSKGDAEVFESAGSEYGLDILAGACSVEVEGASGSTTFARAGNRTRPVDGPPTMIYIPRSYKVAITALSEELTALLVSAPSRRVTVPHLISGNDVLEETYGRDNWHRRVYPSIGPSVDADRLVMGETHTPSGNWSSYPPHKHDEDRLPEIATEEIYTFYFEPPYGFGVQLLWSPATDPRAGLNEAYIVRNGDTVAIPRGYHPNAVAPGCNMVTVWAYAGEQRSWGAWAEEKRFAALP